MKSNTLTNEPMNQHNPGAPTYLSRFTFHVSRFTILVCLVLLTVAVGCGEDAAIKKGKGLLAAGDYQGATAYFQQLVKAQPENPETHYQLGLAYLKLDQHTEAIEALRTAARAASQRMDIQLALGEAYMAAGHEGFALNSFLKILQNTEREDWIQKIGKLTGDTYPSTRLTPNYVQIRAVSTAADMLAFTAYVDDNNEIYVMPITDINHEKKQRLTFNDTADYDPALSPDGKKVAYVSFIRWQNPNDEIFVADINTKSNERLTANTATDSSPTFSPDGSKIAFESNRAGINSEIYIMDADGANQEQLTQSETNNHGPAFSPDGARIAFAAYAVGGALGVSSQICIIDSDGGNFTKLTDDPAINAHPAFSPDGTQIIFDSYRDGDTDIIIMDADGENQRQLTNNDLINTDPIFTPDGKQIVFVGQSDSAENLGVYVMNLEQAFTREDIIKRIEARLDQQ